MEALFQGIMSRVASAYGALASAPVLVAKTVLQQHFIAFHLAPIRDDKHLITHAETF